MQPIIILGAVVVAAALIGTGFLGQGGNIQLFLQQLGWGEADLVAPISHAFIDLELKKVPNDNGTPQDRSDDYFNNLISACSFHSDDDIRAPDPRTELNSGVIICKLTNEDDKAIAEGRILLNGQQDPECPQPETTLGYESSDKLIIEICQTAFPESNEVQNIHDVKIVVEGALDRSMGQ